MLPNSFPFLQGSNIQLYYSYQVCLIFVPLLTCIEPILKYSTVLFLSGLTCITTLTGNQFT